MARTICLFCKEEISISARVHIGDMVSCAVCKTMFRVISLYPLEVDWLDLNEGDRGASGENNPVSNDLINSEEE